MTLGFFDTHYTPGKGDRKQMQGDNPVTIQGEREGLRVEPLGFHGFLSVNGG